MGSVPGDLQLQYMMRLVRFKINIVLFLSLMLMIQTDMFAQSSNKNYIQTKTYLDENGSTLLRHIDYYDELGVVSETVDVGVNTTNTPIKTRTDYNRQLKPLYQWNPVPSIGLHYISGIGTGFNHGDSNFALDIDYQ